MTNEKNVPETIEAYINSFPPQTKKLLKQLRAAIREAAPHAIEVIAYGIPTFKLDGNLVHFAAYKHHIGFYPSPSGLLTFKKELASFKGAKGSVQFPITEDLPLTTIKKIVKFRAKENAKRAGAKSQQFLYELGSPARRALENAGIKTLKQLSRYLEADIKKLHGMGPSTIAKLKSELKKHKLSFKM